MLYRPHSWKLIREQLRSGRIRIFAKAATAQHLAELDKEIADLLAEAKAIADLAEEEKRDLTDEETSRLDAILDEDKGEVYKLKAERAKAEKIIALKKRAASEFDAHARGSRSPLDGPDGGEDDDHGPRSRLPRNIRVVNRLANFSGQDAARDAYDSGMYLRARIARVRGGRDEKAEQVLEARGYRDGGIRNTQVEGTDADGGFLVPDVLERAIIDVRDKHSVMRPLIQVMTMTSLKHLINKRNGGLTVYYPGEEGTYTESKKGWTQFELSAVKRGVLTKVSVELQEDALINVIDDIVGEFGPALGLNQDREIVNGDGLAASGGVTGLVPALGTAGKVVSTSSTWAGLTMDDFTAVLARLPDRFDGYEQNWLVSRTFYYTVMLPLLVEAGGNTIATLEAGAAGGPTFLGYRVVFTEQMPKATAVSQTCCLFGAFKQAAVLGQRTGIEIGQSDQFAFDEDVITLKARERYDIKVHEPGTASVIGAYVGLVTAAS